MLLPQKPPPFVSLSRACAIAACFLGLVLNSCSDQKRVELRWKVFGEIGEVDQTSVVDLSHYDSLENPLPELQKLVGKRVTVKDLYSPIQRGPLDCEFLDGLGQLSFVATRKIKVSTWFYSDRMFGLWGDSMSALPHWTQDTLNRFKLPLFVCDVPAIKDCYAPHLPSEEVGRCSLDINTLQITGRVTHVLEFMDDYYVYMVAEGVKN